MSTGEWIERRAFEWLVRAYSAEFRSEYGAEMRQDFAALRVAAARSGTGRFSLWWRLLSDTARSAPLDRWRSYRARRRAGARGLAADYGAAAVAGAIVFLLYRVTLAPTAAFWDAGEYITVAHVLGIAHPPGNPLFVLLARSWELLLAPTGWSTAVRVNVFSAVMSAGAHALLFLLLERSLGSTGWALRTRRIAAACGVALSATAFTVWHQSNVNEKVYTVSFFTILLCAWLAVRWRDTRRPALLVLAAYITALTMANHLMGVLVAPALLAFVLVVNWRTLLAPRLIAAVIPAVVVALSAHFVLPIRAAEQPLVNQNDPHCASPGAAAVSVFTLGREGCAELSVVLSRTPYQKPKISHDPTVVPPDPPRPRPARLVAAQVVNYLQYLDWQWARPVAGRATLLGWPRPLITSAVLLLAILGMVTQWRSDRAVAVLHATIVLTLSAGLVLYMNFKWGYTMATTAVPERALHEVRERDYFFLIGFSAIGAWAGVGLAALWQRAAHALSRWTARPQLAAAPLLAVALVPLVVNWSWASRADDWTARDWAYNVLMSVEPYGVLVTNGDNDSFPLWYLQYVERVREDVTIVLSPYLGTSWYARQLRDLTRPCRPGEFAASDPSRIVCQRPFRSGQVHPRLLAAWGTAVRAPEDSILPISDDEIDRIANTYLIAQEPMTFRAGSLQPQIDAGTFVTPVETFIAAMLTHTYGDRPIHFMSPSPVLASLGLVDQTVRVGLTWRLRVQEDAGDVAVTVDPAAPALREAHIDLTTTDTLSRDVFLVRGRVTDPRRLWVDHASFDIPLQYTLMHYAAARAHESRGDADGVEHHAHQFEFWNRLASQ